MRLRAPAVVLAVALIGGASAPAAAAPAERTRITFTVTLTSQQQILEHVGRGGVRTYGWNQLTGSTSTPSGDVDVTMLGNVDYVRGKGPFFGFLTVRFASMSTLGLRMTGRATPEPDGSTALAATLRVIGGNAAMTGAKGKGKITGARREELGTAIEITVTLNLRGVT